MAADLERRVGHDHHRVVAAQEHVAAARERILGIVRPSERELAKEIVDALGTGLIGVLEVDLLDQRLIRGQLGLVAVRPKREIGSANAERPTWA